MCISITKMKLTLALITVSLLLHTIAAAPQSPKITSALRQQLQSNNYANILISMKDKTSGLLQQFSRQSFKTRADRLNAVASTLKQHAAESQKEVLQRLAGESGKIRSLWVTNQIYIEGASAELIASLASMDQISEINLDEKIPLDKPLNSHPGPRPDALHAVQWGIENIEAPRAWLADYTGSGAIIATVDTGVRGTHEALRSNFVGGDHAWYDPYVNSREPNDQNGHGTHTTSNIAGSHGVGVAHGAKWMACKGCDSAFCATYALIECGQFMICPTKHDGSDEDCSKAPHIVSNSWGGGRGNLFYNGVIEAYHASGIIPVFSIGNTGPSCSTARSPGEQNVIGVGATTRTNQLASFSSKGPSMYGDHDIKPNVAAPGNEVNSAYHTSDTAYYIMSGTSMAAPHTAGVVALLVGANPDVTFDQVKDLLKAGADHDVVPTGQTCGGIPDNDFPNNSFGHGKVNAYKSVMELVRSLKK